MIMTKILWSKHIIKKLIFIRYILALKLYNSVKNDN